MSFQSKSLSSFLTSSISGTNVTHPFIPSSQNGVVDPAKILTSDSRSEITTSDPVIISNKDLLPMFFQMKEQVEMVIERLRSGTKKPFEATTTSLHSRILDSDVAGSSSKYQGDFLTMEPSSEMQDLVWSSKITTTQDLDASQDLDMFQDPNVTLGSSFQNPGFDIFNTDYFIDSNNFQDPEISFKATSTSHGISRFAPHIRDVKIPKCFQPFKLKSYDGTTDPKEHVARYMEKIEKFPIPAHLKEGCLCKGFGSTLTGPALRWLLSLPPYSITSFSHMISLFYNHFYERLTNDLYRITQGSNESLGSYLDRFCKKSFCVLDFECPTAVQAFHMGLRSDSPFHEDLILNPCKSLLEVRIRASRFVEEEDRMRFKALSIYDRPNRKLKAPSSKSNRAKPYSRFDNHKLDNTKDDECLG